jgi:phospholipid-binding lipoprotein MlaA
MAVKTLSFSRPLLGILLVASGLSSPLFAANQAPTKAAKPATVQKAEAAKSAQEDDTFQDPFDSESAPKVAVKVNDPLEKINRGLFTFNDRLYFWFLKPVATGYKTVAPKVFREHFALFFQNTKYPARCVNCLLQGRVKGAGIETGRFLVNTTVGLAGFFDPASRWKLELQKGDLDQTLGLWRLPTGPYIVWPLFGPSSVRDTFGMAGDAALSPMFYIQGANWLYATRPAEILNTTSLRLGEYEAFKKSNLDPYVSMRSLYFEYWNYRDNGEEANQNFRSLKR